MDFTSRRLQTSGVTFALSITLLMACVRGLAAQPPCPFSDLAKGTRTFPERVQNRLRDWGNLKFFFNEEMENVSLRPPEAGNASPLWLEGRRSPQAVNVPVEEGERQAIRFSSEPGALEFDRDSFSRIATFRQRPLPGSFATRLSGGQWGRLSEAVYAEAVRAAFRDPAKIEFGSLEKSLRPEFEVISSSAKDPIYRRIEWVREKRTGKVHFGLSRLTAGGEFVQLILPLPEKLAFVDHRLKTGMTDSIVLTLHTREQGMSRVWDLKPLLDDRGVGRLETLHTTEIERDRIARLKLQARLGRELLKRQFELIELEYKHSRESEELTRAAVQGVILGTVGAFAIPLATLHSSPTTWGLVAAGLGAVYSIPYVAVRRIAEKHRTESESLAQKVRELESRLSETAPEAESTPRRQSVARQEFTEPPAPVLSLYEPTQKEMASYWATHRDAMNGAEASKILSLFQRAERLLETPEERESLIHKMSVSTLPTGSRSEYDLGYEQGNGYLEELEARRARTVFPLSLQELYARTIR